MSKKKNEKKREVAERLFEMGEPATVIADKLNIGAATVRKWAKDNNWSSNSVGDVEKLNALATRVVNTYETTSDDSLLEMVNSLLPKLISIMNRTLTMYEESDVPVPLREASTLLGKLMDVRGKITGETSGMLSDPNSIRAKTLEAMAKYSKDLPSLVLSKIASGEGVVDAKYEVREIE